MHEPHEAREDTVVFPVCEVLPAAEFRHLAEISEEEEHRRFGPAGFEGMVDKVADIGKSLGISDLSKFTANEECWPRGRHWSTVAVPGSNPTGWNRWGAFFGTALDDHLRDNDVDIVVVAGCNFPNCPRTTLYQASERDYRIMLVDDAASGLDERGRVEMAHIGVTLWRLRLDHSRRSSDGGRMPPLLAAGSECVKAGSRCVGSPRQGSAISCRILRRPPKARSASKSEISSAS